VGLAWLGVMLIKYLGVKPFPQENDGLNGYLLTLAYCQGISKLSKFLALIEMDKPKVKRWGVWDESEIENLITALSTVCDRDTRSSIRKLVDNERPFWCFGETRMFREIRVDFPRVCPLCLVDNRQIHKHWCIGTLARCEVHKELLVDTCPRCDKQLIWQDSLFNGCTHCDFKWTEHTPSPWTNIKFSSYEQNVHPNSNKPNIKNRISGLCATMMAMARPFDIHYQPHQRLPITKHLSEHILKALSILESNDARSLWMSAYRCQRPSKLVHEWNPLDTLNEELRICDIWFTNTINRDPIEFTELESYIKLARRKRVQTGKTEGFRYHVHHDGLARALNISSSELIKLTASETLPRINSTTLIRDQLFDLRQIEKALDGFTALPASKGLITITQKTKELRTYFVSYGWLLKDILNNKIPGCFPLKQDLSEVMMSKIEFEHWLIESFKVACQQHHRKSTVIRALKISKYELYDLIESDDLRWSPLQQGGEAIDGESLKTYMMNSSKYDFKVKETT
jgi:hypothetical protein